MAEAATARPGLLPRATDYGRTLTFRVRRRWTTRFSDLELQQLKSLRRAYGGARGPDLLLFGDSNMLWVNWGERDQRKLDQIVKDQLGGVDIETVVGGGYNPRVVVPFLEALRQLPSRPRAVVVPTSVLMATSTWLAHPVLGLEIRGRQLAEVVRRGGPMPKRLWVPDEGAWEAYDRLPIPSLIGPARTTGELRMFADAAPTSRWQHLVRLRHLLDYYNAETLDADSPGVVLVREMGALLREMDIPSVAHISPINHEMATKLLGPKARDHIARNAEVVESAYQAGAGDLGAVVNGAFDCPSSEFSDPAHVNEAGRRRFGAAIADAVRPFLDPSHRKAPV